MMFFKNRKMMKRIIPVELLVLHRMNEIEECIEEIRSLNYVTSTHEFYIRVYTTELIFLENLISLLRNDRNVNRILKEYNINE